MSKVNGNKKRIKLAVAAIAYGGQVSAQHVNMWIDVGAFALMLVESIALVDVQTWDVNPVDKARNFALGAAMTREADWLLMIDADTFVEPSVAQSAPGEQLLRMILEADAEHAAIVVAPVGSRDPTKDPHVMAYRLGGQKTTKRPEGQLMPLGLGGLNDRRLVPIDSAAAAIMAINLRMVGEARFYFIEETETRAGYSEDHAFCSQIRHAGGKILCDTRVATGHMARPQIVRVR